MAENVLHQLGRDANVEEVVRLLKSPKGPELARQKDEKGNLPLHVAAAIECPDVIFYGSMIYRLLQLHPEGLKEKNQNRDLPLHMITQELNRYSEGKALYVARQFLRIYPEGAGVKDGKGLLPIGRAFQANYFGLVGLIAECDPKGLALRLGLREDDYKKQSSEKNERLESQKELIHNLQTANTTSQAQVTEMQQHLDSEKQRNQTRNTENATLQAQATENQQRLGEQIDGLLSLLVESGAAQVIESFSDLPIPNLKHLITILCRRLDTLLLSDDGGDDRKPSCAQSLAAYLVGDENASRDMLMQCIQTLFSECAPTEGGDSQGAAEHFSTTARAQTSGAARRKRKDNVSSDHQGSQDDAASFSYLDHAVVQLLW